MNLDFSAAEIEALCGMLVDRSSDIFVKVDLDGFILSASHGIAQLGYEQGDWLIGPHIRDFIHPDFTETVAHQRKAAISGEFNRDWHEVILLDRNGRELWFEHQTNRLSHSDDSVYATLSILRNINDRKLLEDRLFAAEQTDGLTGLSNRSAFNFLLNHLVEKQIFGCLALFRIDHFKAINLRYGQTVGDEVLVAFASLLRSLMGSDDFVSRFGGQTLGVLFPRKNPRQATAACRLVIDTIAGLGCAPHARDCSITASAGLSCIGISADLTISRAELALSLARSSGPNCVELDSKIPFSERVA
ncbi:MAG TPA: sensor domain-containing diguanylate cyclase [Sphingomonadaceae bacterium]|nr:sensor domain-containing diguanylate cyclase [Sphingomonadaceae bacterium]